MVGGTANSSSANNRADSNNAVSDVAFIHSSSNPADSAVSLLCISVLEITVPLLTNYVLFLETSLFVGFCCLVSTVLTTNEFVLCSTTELTILGTLLIVCD